MPVYFIQSIIGGPIKVGVARDLSKRIAGIQMCSPFELRVIASMPGSFREELALHAMFDNLRLHGEWFRPEGALVEKIIALGGAVAESSMWRAPPAPTEIALRVDRSGARRDAVGLKFNEGARLTWLAIVDRGMSQNALCRALNVQPGVSNGWLWGDNIPRAANRKKIFQLLAVPVDAWDIGPSVKYEPPRSYPTARRTDR